MFLITTTYAEEEWMVRDDGYFYLRLYFSYLLIFRWLRKKSAEVEEIQFAPRFHQDALDAFKTAEVNTDSAEEMGTEPVNLDEHGEGTAALAKRAITIDAVTRRTAAASLVALP